MTGDPIYENPDCKGSITNQKELCSKLYRIMRVFVGNVQFIGYQICQRPNKAPESTHVGTPQQGFPMYSKFG